MEEPLTTAEKVALLKDMFVHRTSLYAEQTYSEQYGRWWYRPKRRYECDGSCPRGACKHQVDVPITDADLVAHLKGERTLGVYNLREDSTVKWLCIDIDIQKGSVWDSEEAAWKAVWQHTRALAAEFYKRDVPFAVERSGGKGMHIWSFFREPIPAVKAKAVGSFLDNTVKPPEGIATEVFPKQAELRGAGNLVKLPLGIHQKSGSRCWFIRNDGEPHEDQWAVLSTYPLIFEKDIDNIIAENDIDLARAAMAPVTTDEDGISPSTPPCFIQMMRQGLHEGGRDAGMFKLACYMRTRGLTAPMALAALHEVNRLGHPLDVDALELKVTSAYSQPYGMLPCQERLLDSYCTPTCKYYDQKMAIRNGRKSA